MRTTILMWIVALCLCPVAALADRGVPAEEIPSLSAYKEAVAVLNSDSAKKLFPAINIPVIKVEVALEAIPLTSKAHFRGLQLGLYKNKGEVTQQLALLMVRSFVQDLKVDEGESRILSALLQGGARVFIYDGADANFKPSPLESTLVVSPEAQAVLTSVLKNGVQLNSFEHMSFFFTTGDSLQNWFNYYEGSAEQKEIALAYLSLRFFATASKSHSGNLWKPFKSWHWTLKRRCFNTEPPEGKLETILALVRDWNSQLDWFKQPDWMLEM